MLNERVVILYKPTFLLNSMHAHLCLEEHACTGLLTVDTQLKMVSREAVEVCLGLPGLPFLISFLTPCLTALHVSLPPALGGGVPPPVKPEATWWHSLTPVWYALVNVSPGSYCKLLQFKLL